VFDYITFPVFTHTNGDDTHPTSNMSKCTDSYLVYIPLGTGLLLQNDE